MIISIFHIKQNNLFIVIGKESSLENILIRKKNVYIYIYIYIYI